MRKGKEEKTSSSERVNREECRPCKDEVDETKAETGHQGGKLARTCFAEDGAGVEGNNVNATHLLCNHHGPGCETGTANARNRKKLREAAEIVGVADDLFFDENLSVDVVEIARSLDRMLAQAEERSVRIPEAALLDIPPR